jgi:hypothetical protein
MIGGRLRPPARNVQIGTLQDAFLIAAIGMILVIRLQLWATNYPQLGGGGLHTSWGSISSPGGCRAVGASRSASTSSTPLTP